MSNDPSYVRVIKIFVSSPGDVPMEREAMDKIVERINLSDGSANSFRVETFRWEKDVTLRIGRPPQDEVDAQTPEYDIYFGILNMRFGTPTNEYGSGTEQEFRDAMERYSRFGKPWIVVYFRKPGTLDLESSDSFDAMKEYQSVREFRKDIEKNGIVGHFKDITAFVEQVDLHLRKILRSLLETESEKEVQQATQRLRETVTPGSKAPLASVVTDVVRDTRGPILDLIGPTYVLDKDYYFLDWNPAFELIVARPLGLARTDHVVDFIGKLENCSDVIARSEKVFAPGQDPLVDTEILRFRSPDYGLIEFRKIAALISDEKGNPLAWSVNLDIESAEKAESLWRDLEKELREMVNWSRYAVSYDKLLEPFDDYQQLLKLVVDQVGLGKCCVDLGAGTGNGTLKLLEDPGCPDREVWAVESNQTMLEYLRAKTANHSDRLIAVKDDVVRLGALRDQQDYFDAAIMVNVLYAVHDPQACLRRVYSILKAGGVLVLSTPHRDTDVGRLFRKMRQVLQQKPNGLFQSLEEDFEAAKRTHRSMDHLVHRDTKDDIRGYLISAGFDVDEDNWRDAEYADSVIVARAVKPEL